MITSYFCKVFYLSCNMVGSCVTTIFLLLPSILIFELCIMIFWLLLQSISLLDCMMVGSCVTTMLLFVSNLSFKHFFFEKPLYAHNNNVIVNICWKYVSSWIWYGHGKIWKWLYSRPQLMVLAILWNEEEKYFSNNYHSSFLWNSMVKS